MYNLQLGADELLLFSALRLLACLFKGKKYGLDRSWADLYWLAGKLGVLGGLGRGEPEQQRPASSIFASLLLRNEQLEIRAKPK
jgi:hypothetical protein